MASKQKRNGSTRPNVIPAEAAETGEASAASATRNERIRRRAYEIYLERGEQSGRELDDWLQAESELERGASERAS